MIAVDTSVVVGGFASWHRQHAQCRAVLDDFPELPAHAALETYSVLTRLPPPHRAPAAVVAEFLAERFPAPFLGRSPKQVRALLVRLAEVNVLGGAAYDALIGATALDAGATLTTCDRRALETYRLIGVSVDVIR